MKNEIYRKRQMNMIRLAIHFILLTKVKKNIHMNYNLLIKFLGIFHILIQNSSSAGDQYSLKITTTIEPS